MLELDGYLTVDFTHWVGIQCGWDCPSEGGVVEGLGFAPQQGAVKGVQANFKVTVGVIVNTQGWTYSYSNAQFFADFALQTIGQAFAGF